MTIEEIKAYIERKIALIDEEFKQYSFLSDYDDHTIGEHDAYTDALRLLNDWNGK